MANYKDQIRNAYKKRADHYDDGWHPELAEDFVRWLDPKSGEFVLDLACGTGLLSRPLAARVGRTGCVVAVDLTQEMIDVAKSKEPQIDACKIDWIVADVTSQTLLSYPSIQDVVERHGGFDIISLCSALVLLPDQRAALSFWIDKLLRKGGRIIIDVPTESITVQLLMTYHLPKVLGRDVGLAQGRLWIKDQHSLETLFQSVGLKVEQSLLTKSYTGDIWYGSDMETALKVLEEETERTFHWIQKEVNAQEAQQIWPSLWKNAIVKRDGTDGVDGGHRLYVCVGRKAS